MQKGHRYTEMFCFFIITGVLNVITFKCSLHKFRSRNRTTNENTNEFKCDAQSLYSPLFKKNKNKNTVNADYERL